MPAPVPPGGSTTTRGVGWRRLPFLLVGALTLVLAVLLHRSSEELKQASAPASAPARSPERAARHDERLARLLPALARPLPRFVPKTPAPPPSSTIHGDLAVDARSLQAGTALYAEQERDTGWAPRMEQHLRERLAPAALEKIGLGQVDLRVETIECRTFGCQVRVDWSSEPGSGPGRPTFQAGSSPLRYLDENGGPLAVALMRQAREETPARRTRETFLLFYRTDRREPDAWPGSGHEPPPAGGK